MFPILRVKCVFSYTPCVACAGTHTMVYNLLAEKRSKYFEIYVVKYSNKFYKEHKPYLLHKDE